MVIGKTLQNNNFKETSRYVLDKEEAQILGGTVMGSNSDIISREFLMSRDLNPEVERPVYHLILAYSYEDAATKNLTDEFLFNRSKEFFAGLVVSAREPELLRQQDKTEYKQKVNDFLETEIYEYQWFAAAHEDTKHRHTHFVASRENLINGRCIPTWQDKERSHRICREMEKEQGLEQLQSYYEIERRSPTRGQLEEWEKTGIPPVMVQMQDAIDREAKPGRPLDQVVTALRENHGVEAKIGLYKGTQGVVFEQTDSKGEIVRMSGSQLGRGYTLPAIGRRLERDIKLEPPGVEPETEVIPEPDPLEQVMREQAGYAERLAPQIQEIWEREKSGRPKLKTATFEDYQIRLSEEDQPELYRRDRQVLGHSEGEYQAYGLTEQDCNAMERFNALSQQQAQERLQQLEFQQRQQEREKEKVKSRSQEQER